MVNRVWFANIPSLGISADDRAQLAVGYGRLFARAFNPLAPKFAHVSRTQKVVQTDSKPKFIQSSNPFKAVN